MVNFESCSGKNSGRTDNVNDEQWIVISQNLQLFVQTGACSLDKDHLKKFVRIFGTTPRTRNSGLTLHWLGRLGSFDLLTSVRFAM